MQEATTETDGDYTPTQRRIALAHITVVSRRLHEDGESLLALGKSLRQGQLQPIGVMEIAEQAGAYQLIWGERRLRAALRVGLTQLTAVVLPPMELAAALIIAWRENTERAAMTDVERLGMVERVRTALGNVSWKVVETALRITVMERKRLMALKRLDPEALVEMGKWGLTAWEVEPLLQFIRQRQLSGQRSIPEMMQVRILRDVASRPTNDHCRRVVAHYYPPAHAVQQPEPDRLVNAFASRLASLTDAISDVRRASQLTDGAEKQSLLGSIGRSIAQLEGLRAELREPAEAQAA